MKRYKKQIAILLTACLTFAVMMPLSVFAVEKPTLSVEFNETGSSATYESKQYPVWKMIVKAGAPSGVEVLVNIFSMDTDVIKPAKIVYNEDYSEYWFEAVDISDGSKEEDCFIVEGIYKETLSPGKPPTYNYYAAKSKGWAASGTHIAYDYSLYVPEGQAGIQSKYYGMQPMYEFYYIIIDKPYEGCIKLETNTKDGSLISKLYNNPLERGGIVIKSGGVENFYKDSDKESIDYSIIYPSDAEKKVSTIDITAQPTKTDYIEGQSFDPAGMVVTATYADDTTAAVTGYTITPSGALGAADTSVTVSYPDPFDGAVYTATQNIAIKKLIKEGDFTFDLTDKTYQAAPWTPSVTSSTLTESTDYSVAYTSNTNVGAATITVTGMGAYTGVVSKTFEIVQADATVNVGATAQLYVGGNTMTILPGYSVVGLTPTYVYQTSNAEIVTVDADGVMTAVSAGEATITVTATDPAGNYKVATAIITVTVSDKMNVSANITFNDAAGVTYTGTEHELGAKFTAATFGGTPDGTGTIKYQYGGTPYNNLGEITGKVKNAGMYEVTAIYEDDSQYGTKTASFVISAAAITVTPNELSKTYGDDDPVLTYGVTGKPGAGVAINGTLSRTAGEDAGTYVIDAGLVTNANNSNYDITFTAGKLFTINGKSLAAADLEYQGDSITKVYDGATNAAVPAGGKVAVKQSSLAWSDVSPTIIINNMAYNSKDVVTANQVTCTLGALTGNYVLAADTTLTHAASITAKDIAGATVNLTEASKPYNGADQSTTVASVVLDSATLNAATDYDVTKSPSQTDVGFAIYEVTGKGNYTGTATATFSVTKADTTIAITDAAGSLNKPYDGTSADDPAATPSIAGTVSFKHYTDAASTDELAAAPVDAGTYYVKAFLEGTTNYKDAESAAFAYTITQKDLGAVTLEIPAGFSVTKEYDGTTNAGTRSGDSLIVPTGIGTETLHVNITATGSYGTKDVNTNMVVALSVGSTLSDGSGKASNYTTGAAFPITFNFDKASITAADYTVTVAEAINVKIGSTLSALPTALTTGVSAEKPAGGLEWYSDSNRTTAMTDDSLKVLALGTHNLYWKFTTTDGNYTAAPKTGTTAVTIVEGDPQNIAINGTPSTVTYGDGEFTLTAAVTTTGDALAVGGGAITWSSSDAEVASVDSTGKVTVKKAGTTTITATAAAVPGTYAAGSKTWELTVEKIALTVTAGTYAVTKEYDGTTNPGTETGALTVSGILASDDFKVAVNITLPAYTSKAVVINDNLAAALSLSGDQAANYKLASPTVSVPCSITAKDITTVSVTGVTKTYDGGTGAGDAVISGEPTLTGKVAGDDLGIGLTVTGFSDADVATADKTANITLGALTGADSGNYNLTATSPITAAAIIIPAGITGFDTAAPTKAIFANDGANANAATLKTDMALPGTVTIKYGTSSTAVLSINWADATEAFEIKGGTYTYKGTVVNGSNFNAYATTLDAVLTVNPVAITGIAGVDGSMTKAKADVLAAANMGNLGFPAQVTLNFDNAVPNQDVDAEWDTTLASLKTLADSVTASTDKTKTVILTNTNFPAWATMTGVMPSTLVTITNKLVIDPADITFADATITYGDALSQDDTVNLTKYPGATATYVYTGTGTTTYGPSATPPVNAGTYTVIATVENDTHKGTKSATLTISAKVLATVAVSAISDHGYTGSPITPAYTVTGDASIALVDGVDYDGVFSANTDVGTATLTVTCKGNYTGTGTTTFEINKVSPTITFSNTNQTLTAAGGNITDVVTTLNPHSAGASVTVHYWVVVTPKADCNVVHDDGCASIVNGDIAYCNCTQTHTVHDGSCGYVAADVYGWVTTVPQVAGTYKIYASTPGDSNLDANTSAPDLSTVTDTLLINPYKAGGSKPSAPPVTPPVVEPPVTSGGITTSTMTVTPQTTGTTSTASVPAGPFNSAAAAATQQAGETGTGTNVTLNVDMPPAARRLELSLPAASLGTLLEQDGEASLTVTSGIGTVTFNGAALQAIGEAATGSDIVIVAEDLSRHSLTPEQQALVGDNPVIDLYVMSGGKRISDFNGGSAVVSIPYTLRDGEDPAGIVVWYLTEGGKLEKKVCTYDPVTGMATFTAEHFSQYAVAYFPFVDLEDGEWYYENTVYAYMNGLMNGVSKDEFKPEAHTTRSMVVTMLWRLEGQPGANANAFTDVADGKWYTDAISWAAENGIVTGYNSSKFGPDDPVTREQMATILFNYGNFKKQNTGGRSDLAGFADAGQVSSWAEAPVKWAVEKGIIGGTGKGLEPGSRALRAQVAAIFQRYIEGNK